MNNQEKKQYLIDKRIRASALTDEITSIPLNSENKATILSKINEFEQVISDATQVHDSETDLFAKDAYCMARARLLSRVNYVKVRALKLP